MFKWKIFYRSRCSDGRMLRRYTLDTHTHTHILLSQRLYGWIRAWEHEKSFFLHFPVHVQCSSTNTGLHDIFIYTKHISINNIYVQKYIGVWNFWHALMKISLPHTPLQKKRITRINTNTDANIHWRLFLRWWWW